MILDFFRKVFGMTDADPQPIKPPGFEPVSEHVVPDEAIEMIKHFESCKKRLPSGMIEAYPDPGYGWKVPTIGWGTVKYKNGKKVMRGDLISQEKADAEFEYELMEKAAGVLDLVKVQLTPAMLGALTSFAYNAGTGALKKSTLLRKLNEADYSGAANEFLKWNKSNGKALAGLTRRRNAEREMFLGGDWMKFRK